MTPARAEAAKNTKIAAEGRIGRGTLVPRLGGRLLRRLGSRSYLA